MPGISDSRINAGGKLSFGTSKTVTATNVVSGDITQQATASSQAINDLQGRVTLLEAKLVATSNETVKLSELVDDLLARLTAAEATIAAL